MYDAVTHVKKDTIGAHAAAENEVHREIKNMHNVFEDNLLYATIRMY